MGEGLWMGGISSASAEEISSWIDLGLHEGIRWKGSFLGYDLEVLSPSIMVLWSRDPPVMISSYRTDSLLRHD